MVTKTKTYVDIVRDGDSFHSLPAGEVRLVNVCAPEKGKPGYAQAKSLLEGLILRKHVTLSHHGRDVFGRVLADVYVGNTHVNAQMRSYGYRC